MEFSDKQFLMKLCRNFGKQQECQRKLLLLGFYDKSGGATESQSSGQAYSSQANESISDTSDKGKAIESSCSLLSPLKCQMNQITINPESSVKKKLIMGKFDDDEWSSNSEG